MLQSDHTVKRKVGRPKKGSTGPITENLPKLRRGPGRPPKEQQNDFIQEYNEARAKKEAANAQLAEIELQTREGELVYKSQVREAAFNAGRKIRDTLLSIPDRVGPILAGESNVKKVQELLTKEIRDALEHLSTIER